jgi:accessory gene regulator protein AgrB
MLHCSGVSGLDDLHSLGCILKARPCCIAVSTLFFIMLCYLYVRDELEITQIKMYVAFVAVQLWQYGPAVPARAIVPAETTVTLLVESSLTGREV